MQKILIVAAVAAAVAGCTRMEQYYPDGKVVTVDGIEFSVSPMGRGPNTYKAMPNNPRDHNLLFVDPGTWARNVKAIELATGCPVAPGSIKNGDNYTFAYVDCPSSPTAPQSPES